jgi:hypothetical protein
MIDLLILLPLGMAAVAFAIPSHRWSDLLMVV